MSSQVTIVGNVTRSPEIKYVGNGNAVVDFSVAVNRRKKGKDGEYEDVVSYFDVTAFGTLAENIANSLDKGNRVVVTGRLEQQTWDDKDGNKRSKVQIVADEVGAALSWATAQVTKTVKSSEF